MTLEQIEHDLQNLRPVIDGKLLDRIISDIVYAGLLPANLDQCWSLLARQIKVKIGHRGQAHNYHPEIVAPSQKTALLNAKGNPSSALPPPPMLIIDPTFKRSESSCC